MSDEKQAKAKAPKAKAGGKAKAEAAPEKAKAKGKLVEERVTPRLQKSYKEQVIPALMKRFSYRNVMQVPRLDKIAINVGVGQATQDPKMVETVAHDLELIVGQKVVITRAKKSISNFKLREKMPIGCRVTLRRARMYEFMDRFVAVAIPRLRDFRGLPDRSFDGRGNYTIGVKEHTVFPEIDVDKVVRVFGMDITFVTTARNDQEAYELLKALGMPFVKRQDLVETKAQA